MAVSGRWTCTLLHLESAIRWPGTGGGYDSKGADLLDRRTMYFAVWISQDRDHPRVAVPPFRAIEFYEIGGHDRRDWIREHRLRFARGLHLTVYCLDKRIRHLSRNARLYCVRTSKILLRHDGVLECTCIRRGKRSWLRVIPGSQVRDTWLES